MNTPLEAMTSVKGYLVFESFSAPVFRYVELTSQGCPWAVQHLGDIRHADILGAVAKLNGCALFGTAFQSTAKYFQQSFRTRISARSVHPYSSHLMTETERAAHYRQPFLLCGIFPPYFPLGVPFEPGSHERIFVRNRISPCDDALLAILCRNDLIGDAFHIRQFQKSFWCSI